jgi:excisionase family DNA binding protein
MASKNQTPDRLLRKKEVAELLACSPRTIERLADSGGLSPVKLGRAVRYRESEIMAIIKGAGHD